MYKIIKFKRHSDKRGMLSEIMRNDLEEFKKNKIKQINYSITLPGEKRGMHKHKKQIDYMLVLKGKIKLCLEKNDKKLIIEHSPNNKKYDFLIKIPSGVWHGYENVGNEPAMVLYMFTEVYDYDNPDEEKKEFD